MTADEALRRKGTEKACNEQDQERQGARRRWYSPISGELDFGHTVTAVAFVKVTAVAVVGFVARAVLVDAKVFLVAARTVFLVGEIELEGRVAIFPSDALLVDLSFYSGLSSLCCDVVTVRRREDAEWYRDSTFKIQGEGEKCEGLSC